MAGLLERRKASVAPARRFNLAHVALAYSGGNGLRRLEFFEQEALLLGIPLQTLWASKRSFDGSVKARSLVENAMRSGDVDLIESVWNKMRGATGDSVGIFVEEPSVLQTALEGRLPVLQWAVETMQKVDLPAARVQEKALSLIEAAVAKGYNDTLNYVIKTAGNKAAVQAHNLLGSLLQKSVAESDESSVRHYCSFDAARPIIVDYFRAWSVALHPNNEAAWKFVRLSSKANRQAIRDFLVTIPTSYASAEVDVMLHALSSSQ